MAAPILTLSLSFILMAFTLLPCILSFRMVSASAAPCSPACPLRRCHIDHSLRTYLRKDCLPHLLAFTPFIVSPSCTCKLSILKHHSLSLPLSISFRALSSNPLLGSSNDGLLKACLIYLNSTLLSLLPLCRELLNYDYDLHR